MNGDRRKPKVSVCVITYNHEKYIHDCLQSILEQKVDFNIEIIIGDDFSKDATRTIILDYIARYPDIIKSILPDHKIGGTQNYLQVHRAATGNYIAHVDGDDFLYQGKLQSQVDLLDANPDIAMAAHAVRKIENGRLTETIFGGEKTLPKYADLSNLLMLGTYFTNSSIMYRSINRFEHMDDRNYVDFYFHIEQASKGFIYLDKRVLGCYRVHSAGITRDLTQRDMIEKCYEQAFDRAIELGAPIDQVQTARLRKRMVFAIERYLIGDLKGYLSHIQLNVGDMKFASVKHKLLFHSRRIPTFVDYYFKIKGIIK